MNIMSQQEITAAGFSFIAKPYRSKVLLKKVREEVLDNEREAVAGP